MHAYYTRIYTHKRARTHPRATACPTTPSPSSSTRFNLHWENGARAFARTLSIEPRWLLTRLNILKLYTYTVPLPPPPSSRIDARRRKCGGIVEILRRNYALRASIKLYRSIYHSMSAENILTDPYAQRRKLFVRRSLSVKRRVYGYG